MSLETQIEGVLFYKTEPLKKTSLAKFLNVSLDEIERALKTLSERLKNGATRLVSTDSSVQLVLSEDLFETIDQLTKNELTQDIGKAGAETLAIILYRGPMSRFEIDRIRGVNSSFILRNLLIRGLIEKSERAGSDRVPYYAVTTSLLNHIGITEKQELPEFESVMNALDAFEKERNLDGEATSFNTISE